MPRRDHWPLLRGFCLGSMAWNVGRLSAPLLEWPFRAAAPLAPTATDPVLLTTSRVARTV